MAAGSPYLRVTYAETNRILPEPYQRVLVAAIAVAALALPAFGNAYVIYLLNLTLLAIIGSVGLNLLTGYCGQVSKRIVGKPLGTRLGTNLQRFCLVAR